MDDDGEDELERWLAELRGAQESLLRSAIDRSGLPQLLRDLDDRWRAERDPGKQLELRSLADRLAAVRTSLLAEELLPRALPDRLRAHEVDVRAASGRWFRR